MRQPAALLVVLVAGALLAVNVTESVSRVPEPIWNNLPPRFWEDVHMAEALYMFHEFPVTANEVLRRDEKGAWLVTEARRHFAVLTAREGLPRWAFWRTVPSNRFLRPAERAIVDRYDDSGRPLLLAAGFAVLGGIAPFLLFWLGYLLAVPVLLWTSWELARAGWTLAGAILVLLVGASPFFGDALALSYSTAGFHVLALLAVLPLSAYAALSDRPGASGLVVRSVAGGLVFGACTLARGGVILVAGAYVVALGVGAWRAAAGGSRRRRRALGVATVALVMLTLPYACARAAVAALGHRTAAAYGRAEIAPQRHAFWFGMWTGLGDFDREKGFTWNDRAASAAGVAAGGTPLSADGYDPANEAVFRSLVLADVRSDPAWYGGIVVSRFLATVTQWKLWPWPPVSGRSIAPARSPNEGVVDSYYALVTPPDRIGAGGSSFELPIPLLAAPAAAIVVLALRRSSRARWAGPALVLLALGAGALPLPILVTTAGAIETEAFAIVYLAGAALLAGGVSREGWPSSPEHAR